MEHPRTRSIDKHETWNVLNNNLLSSILASCLLNNYVLDVFHVQHNQTAELQYNFKLFLKQVSFIESIYFSNIPKIY